MANRRTFLKSVALGAAATASISPLFSSPRVKPENSGIACQQYTWMTYFKREGMTWLGDPQTSLEAYVRSGLSGYEPSFSAPSEVAQLNVHLKNNDVWCKSMYVNSVLHEEELAEKNISDIIAISKEAHKIGIRILVTNPTPIRWGGPENKSDKQLQIQAKALNRLGGELNKIGIDLAYHNHDAEMREGAREFHHMLTGTDPEHVKLCLDAHWIYRGAGNSQVALFDIVSMYADRIVELHLRQSHDGIWSEVFENGDIDYSRLASILKKKGLKPHVVLEQAIEKGTPHTMNTVEAMSKSLNFAKEVFAGVI